MDVDTLHDGTVHVVAGALIGADDRVLIAERPMGRHLAGGWEFPGGKLDPGEDREAGLCRELREELGIAVLGCRPLIRLRHDYSDRKVLLDVWLVERFSGEPASLDGQALRWCERDALPDADLLPADRPVVTALRLPAAIRSVYGPHYKLRAFRHWHSRPGDAGMLLGASCDSAAEALAADAAGADFIAFAKLLPAQDLSDCCARIGRPVYVCGVASPAAWALGAAGIIDLAAPA